MSLRLLVVFTNGEWDVLQYNYWEKPEDYRGVSFPLIFNMETDADAKEKAESLAKKLNRFGITPDEIRLYNRIHALIRGD